MTPEQRELLRALPSISELLEHHEVQPWLAHHPRAVVVAALQAAVDHTRSAVKSGGATGEILLDDLLILAADHLHAASQPSLRRVINATGVVLHTGLGRAPLCQAAVDAVADVAGHYSNLELDLDTGARGRRTSHIVELIRELTGAEAATVVNNNAAATLLTLNTVAAGCEVVVSRGQLVEIGGSYRLPEMMLASGARLREVGTTNRTRIADYERAIGDNTAALMRVHTSNYKLVGFTEDTPLEELVALARKYGKLVLDDLGSGALFDLTQLGLPAEPYVRASIAAGADLVFFSGDKLLGGPQAGIIVGRADLIRRIEKNPLMRTYRVGKMTLAALTATLHQYRDPAHAAATIPSLARLTADPADLRKRAGKLARALRKQLPDHDIEVVDDVSVPGGGSLPGHELATTCVAWRPADLSVDDALTRLRGCTPPIIARAARDTVLFDPRTLYDDDLAALPALIASITGDQ